MPHRASSVAAFVAVISVFVPQAALAHAAKTVEGTVVLVHGDDFRHARTHSTYLLDTGRRRLSLRSLPRRLRLQAGERLRLRGSRVERLRRDPRRKVAAASGPRKVGVILVNFSDNASQPFSVDQVRQVMFTALDSVNAYYREQSFGQISFAGQARVDGDVFGWYTISANSSGCQTETWAQAANFAAAAAGADLSHYDHLVYAFPYTPSCAWVGQGALPGSRVWVNGTFNRYVVGHELGHNLGLQHANTLNCTEAGRRVALGSACAPNEYGDPFDVMGSGARHMSGWHKGRLGWLGAANRRTATSSGLYSVLPVEPATLGTQSLRIPRGNSGTYLMLEYRQPFGSFFDNFAAGDPVVSGVTIRVCPDYAADAKSLLVDATPETETFLDASLSAGRTFYDPVYRIAITTQSATALEATVSVTFDAAPPPPPAPPPDTTPPSAPAALKAQTAAGPSVKLSWSGASDNAGVAGYRVFRNGRAIATTGEASYSDAAVSAADSFTYFVRAYDGAGNLGGASPSAGVKIPARRGQAKRPRLRLLAGSAARVGPVRAGRRLVASLRVRRSDSGRPLGQGIVLCRARVSHRPLVLVSKHLRRGRAVCVWRVPKRGQGKRLAAAVAVGYRGAFVRRRLVVLVR
jgi:gametolysin peptidase M11